MLAARMARGRVVDCACGIGYGSDFLRKQAAVEAYLGVDPSNEAVGYALENYAGPGVEFCIGTLEALPCPDASVDTFIMFETLEHTVKPEFALASVRRCLKSGGLLIGSVPSAEYEALCEETYGPNPYHLQRFTKGDLETLLGRHFDAVRMFSAEFVLGTLICPLPNIFDAENSAARIVTAASNEEMVSGSLLFVAGDVARVEEALRDFGSTKKFFAGLPKVLLDQEEVEPIRKAFYLTEAAVAERDEAIAAQGEMLEARWATMQSMDAVIAAQHEALNAVVSSVGTKCQEAICQALRPDTNAATPFVDMAFSLALFTERLYRAARTEGVQDLFFFAREGQPLKEMFDFRQSLHSGADRIRTHYLKVSRRSTFLLSLGPLGEETFDVLFRQYRRISILDFLKSLDLDEYAPPLASALGLAPAALDAGSDDLPNDTRFCALLQLDLFRQIYEEQRTARSTAFERYLRQLLGGGPLPPVLHVVDVGWKGSIQDNLHNWLRKVHGDTAQIEGYYLGLVATGAMSSTNRKTGLLFSNIGGHTPGFNIFNENRALFEIVLHADHGSARRYVMDEYGAPAVIEDAFEESTMIGDKVSPVSRPIIAFFRRIAATAAAVPLSDAQLLKSALKRHSRMVFHPSREEVDWVFSVSHVENFGVFEESRFGRSSASVSLPDKAAFTWNLISRWRQRELGFWPWLTIRTRALPGLNTLYCLFRQWQRN